MQACAALPDACPAAAVLYASSASACPSPGVDFRPTFSINPSRYCDYLMECQQRAGSLLHAAAPVPHPAA